MQHRLDRARRELMRVAHTGHDVPRFFAAATDVIRGSLHFDGCSWLTIDPATCLMTSHFGQDSIEDVMRLAQNEYAEEDVNKFAELALRSRPAGILHDATRGQPAESIRYRELLRPNGLAAELRTSLVEGGRCWGGAALYRTPEAGEFDADDVRLMGELAGLLAVGLRRAILTAALSADDMPGAPGLILFDAEGGVEAMTPAAERWLAELPAYDGLADGNVPSLLYALASRARRIGAGADAERGARSRLRTTTGRWLVLHGSLLDDDGTTHTAVMIEPVTRPEVSPAIVAAYGLGDRERDVIQLVLQGLSIEEVGERLHLPPWTVQEHVGSILGKVGVESSVELPARIFREQYAPRMGTGENLAADGWFADPVAPSAGA